MRSFRYLQHFAWKKSMLFAVLGLYLMISGVVTVVVEVAERTDTVVGVEGKSVDLPCDVRPPTREDDVALVLWYKDESTTPLYSLDSRRRGLHQAKHAPGSEVANRANLDMTRSPSLLRLDLLKQEDEGEYRCRVDFKIARSRNVLVILEIITLPKPPIVRNEKGEILQRIIGPYNVGESLYLVCEVEGGKPAPSVTWWKDSILVDDTFHPKSKGGSVVVSNEIAIENLDRSDLHSVFSCRASNNNISTPISSSVTIDMNLPPVEVVLENKHRPLSANKQAELICRAGGSRPPANITWSIGRNMSLKGRAQQSKISSEGNITTGTMTFVPDIEDGGKNITCKAENYLVAGSGITDSWQIDVHYIPQLSLRLGSKLRHSHIQEGKDVYLECTVVANPPVMDVGWRFEGRELHTDKSAGVIVSSRSLVLQRVKRGHRGRYTCDAENAEGRGESAPLYLRVQYSPVCKKDQKVLYGVARHESVKVTCDVEADPTKTNFTWRFNNSAESLDIMSFVSNDTRSIATYIPRTEYDYGTLLCWGRNSVGGQKEPCVFTVIPAGPPDPVQNCSSSNETEDSLVIRCQEGYDGGLRQGFMLEMFAIESPDDQSGKAPMAANHMVSNATNVNFPIFSLVDLPPGMSFVVVVYAFNARGRSEGTVVRANTLATPESLTQRDDLPWPSTFFSPLLVALICVVVILVLAAISVVLAVKAQRNSSRRSQSPEKDPQKHGNDKSLTPLRQDDEDDRRGDLTIASTTKVFDSSSSEDNNRCPDLIPPGVEMTEAVRGRGGGGALDCRQRPDIQSSDTNILSGRNDMGRQCGGTLPSASPTQNPLHSSHQTSPDPFSQQQQHSSAWNFQMHQRPTLKQVPSPSVPLPQLPLTQSRGVLQPLLDYPNHQQQQQQQLPLQHRAVTSPTAASDHGTTSSTSSSSSSTMRAEWTLPRTNPSAKAKNRQTDV